MEFIEILKDSLNERCKNNSSYSLRAFSRDLGIDPANMSRMLSRKTNPHKSTQEKILLKLGYSAKEASNVVQGKLANANELEELRLEEFEIVSEWYHDAILELTRLSFFKPDINWIANTLDINPLQVKFAAERLIKLGYLEITKTTWIDKTGNNTTYMDDTYTNQALKNLQVGILEKSIKAVNEVDINKRDHSSVMLNVDSSDMPEVKKRIKKFRTELYTYLTRAKTKPDSVYQLHIGMFPLTKG